MTPLNRRQRINCLVNELRLHRASYEPVWRDLANFMLPYRLRLQLSEYNRGDRRNTSIYDSTATSAVDAFESGMMASVSSPAKRWMRFFPASEELQESGRVRQWCDQVTNIILSMFDNSDAYLALPTFYGNLGGFGVGAMSVLEDFEDGIITETFAPGSFFIGQDHRRVVNTFFHEFRMTVRQLYLRFGKDADFSSHVRHLIDDSKWEEWVDVGHLISPNEDHYTDGRKALRDKPFYSCWYEIGSSSASGQTGYASEVQRDRFIHEGGFQSFPVVCGRWKLTSGETYAPVCPGISALGDTKTLQIGEKRGWQFVEKLVHPTMILPTELEGEDNGFVPGEPLYVDDPEGKRARPLYDMNPAFMEPLRLKQDEVRGRINDEFLVDLWKLYDQLEDRDRTATEIMAREGEKFRRLFPVFTQLSRESLKPLIRRTYEIATRQGRIPPPPEELAGQTLDIEYLGILAQAQKAVVLQPMTQLIMLAGQIASLGKPDVMDKLNTDQFIDEAGKALGTPASLIHDDEQTAAMREEKAKLVQQQMMAQQIPAMAKSARDLSAASLEGDNALAKLVGAA